MSQQSDATGATTDIDAIAVLRSLGVEPAGTLQPVSGGWDTALFRFRTPDNSEHALRAFRSPNEAPRARREQIALRAAGAAGVPVPRIEACACGTWRDLPAVVLSWVPGRNVLDALQSRPWTACRLGTAFGRMQAAIHAVPAPEELRDPALGEFAGNFVEWARALDPALPPRLNAAGLTTGRLVHGDYHPLNVMTDRSRITAVIDWPSAASSDPRVDVARTAVLLDTGPLPPGPIRVVAGVLRGVFRRAWLRGYDDAAGPVKDIEPFMVTAGLSWLEDLRWAAGRPGVWDDRLDAAPVAQWTERWRRLAGMG